MALRVLKVKNIPLTLRPPSPSNPLGVPRIEQEQTEWCWAACADMVLEFYKDPAAKQCHLANSASPAAGDSCCGDPTSQVCNRPLSDTEVSQLWTDRQVRNTPLGHEIGFQDLKDEIDDGRPVEVGWSRGGNGNHLVIVHGWQVTSTGEQVYVNDPAKGQGEGWMSLSDLQTARQTGFWTSTWVGLTRD